MSKFARRITVVSTGGAPYTRVIYKKKGRKKGSPWLRPLQNIEHRLLKADVAYAGEALRRHERSSRRKRDGWITDAFDNIDRATRKAYRVYRKIAPQLLPKKLP